MTAADPSLSWPHVRITSSTSIQSIVSSSLAHLSNPSSLPLILHTLPSPSNSSSGVAVIPKNSHAGLCKLISVVEIIKRKLEPHQKALWAIDDEEAKKVMIKKSTKGKKRAREEDDDGVQSADVEQRQGDNANPGLQAAEVSNDAQKTASEAKKEKKKHHPLLRVYQYNLLDAYERLPGASTSTSAAEEAQSDNDAENTLAEGGGTTSTNEAEEEDDDDDEQRENSRIQADLVQSKIKAAKSLDEAIRTHVMRVQKKAKRAPKKHTPYMKIILSTRKLPEYESFLKPSSSSSSNKEQILTTRPRDYTIQLPPKKSRSRTHKQRKSKKSRDEEKEEGQLDDEPSKISKEGNKSGDAAVAGIVQDQQGNIKSSNLQGSASLEVQTEQLPANPLKSPAPQSKKRKADAIESQSSEATQKSSQM